MIQVTYYKAGNITSVVKALNFLGAETHVTQSPDDVRGASKIVLPGVSTLYTPAGRGHGLEAMSYTAVYTKEVSRCNAQRKFS